MRTYSGHLKAIRDMCFNNDGSNFISCSYDRYIKLWDTETGKRERGDVYLSLSLLIGQCINRFCNQKTAYCLAYNPDSDKQHLFIAGCADKKIYTVRHLM